VAPLDAVTGADGCGDVQLTSTGASGTFYYTLPSRSKSSALHPYFRNTYYQYYHELPPPPGAIMPLTWREAYDCGNYSFMRPNRVMPYGFKCQK